MEIVQTKLKGVYEIIPKVFGDHRGWFSESFNLSALNESGLDIKIVQENHSYTALPGAIRGLHFQNNPMAQTKIVRCTAGRICDVAVDLRKGSPTYKQWVMVELSSENKKQLFIAKGLAHGFVTLSPNVEIQYLVDSYYSPAHDRSIRYDDPALAIDWKVEKPILSAKDENAPLLCDSDCNFKY